MVCDPSVLSKVVETLCPEWLVGVGAFAARRAAVLGGFGAAVPMVRAQSVRITSILQPSPASPQANRDWAAQAEGALTTQGIW